MKTHLSLIRIMTVSTLFFVATGCNKQMADLPQDSARFSAHNLQKTTGTFTSYNYTLPLTNLVYYNQWNTGCTNSVYRANGCLPASCLMGAHLMNPAIAATSATFSNYCAGMGTTTSGTSIVSAYPYLHNNVFSSNFVNQATPPSGVSVLSTNIRSYLSSNHPVVALICYSTSTKTPSNSGINHFVLIVGLNETSLGSGTVYYIDPNNNAGTKSASWATFISAMSSAATNWNYMRIGN